jgi:AraC-like DNA-binding protein
MQFNFSFYSSLLLIFFVHGLVYAILLYRKAAKQETQADKWLSLFLILCIFYISPWMLGFAGWYDHQPYRDIMFYIPTQQLFFIGPVIFFYVQSLLNPSFKFGKKEWLHLLPGIIYLLYSLVIFVTDKIILKKYYFLADGTDKEFDQWYGFSGFVSMLLYFLLSLRYFNAYKKFMSQVISYSDTLLFRWIKNFLYAFLGMMALRFLFFVCYYIPAFQKLNYVGPWWEYFSFALLFYYIAITGYSNSIETNIPFKLNLLNYKKVLLLNKPPLSPGNELPLTEDAEIISIETENNISADDENLLKEWKPKLLQYIINERAFEDPELSLTQVAKSLKTNPSLISKVINKGFQQNFNDFINYFRIEAVKLKLEAGEQKTQTLLGIAFDCGFNSKATFNRAFKKATGLSPKDFIERL